MSLQKEQIIYLMRFKKIQKVLFLFSRNIRFYVTSKNRDEPIAK